MENNVKQRGCSSASACRLANRTFAARCGRRLCQACTRGMAGLLWFACTIALTGSATAQLSEILLHNFQAQPRGAFPYNGVIRDSAGNLYGTTSSGGAFGYGVVFKLDVSGRQTLLYSFAGGADGANPSAGLIRDPDGNLYGTASSGGTTNSGVVFKVDPAGHQTVLHDFTGGLDGGYPNGGVIRDSNGNLYGTATVGGTGFAGVVYRLDTTGRETVLHNFTGGADGAQPYSHPIGDSAGNLYGTTPVGGSGNAGVIYKISAKGHLTVLYSFSGGVDGYYPQAGLIRDQAGNLYGTANYGGTLGMGVVYRLDITNQETTLYNFTGGTDGMGPSGGVIRDLAGNLYGTASGGTTGNGVVFKLAPSGKETPLYSFQGGMDGTIPCGGLILDAAGILCGSTAGGGPANAGVIYKLDRAGMETVIYGFPSGADGMWPTAGVIRDSAGNLYGTTPKGGPANAGVVYRVDAAGHETVLYSFQGGSDGANSFGSLVRDPAGNLYGTTQNGGTASLGVVFKLDTSGHETVLHQFGGTDGAAPASGVILDSAGNLYGTTTAGGDGWGLVYKLDVTGQETVLYKFTGGADGGVPIAALIRDAAGNLYGTANNGGPGGAGVVYKIDPSGHETVLYGFTGGADGGFPQTAVCRDSAGNLYGTTSSGGAMSLGAVYKVDANGQETVLYSFTDGGMFGASPSGLIRDPAGNLYGTAEYGGTAYQGMVFKLDPTDYMTVLYSFSGADGAYPLAGVIRDSQGRLYGTTYSGGKRNGGVVFKLLGAAAD